MAHVLMVLVPMWMLGSLVTCLFVAAAARTRGRDRAPQFGVPLYVPREWVSEYEAAQRRRRAEA